MPEGINRASRKKDLDSRLRTANSRRLKRGNDDFEAVICDFMVILQCVFTRKIYSAFALGIIRDYCMNRPLIIPYKTCEFP